MKAVSEIFLEACEGTSHSGSTVIDCELCGRTHFNSSDTGCFEEGELEQLQKEADKDPEKYVETDYTIPWLYVDDKQAVIGCPCNKLAYYEHLFWQHRKLIANYFTARAKRMTEYAQEAEIAAGKVRGAAR